LHLLIIDILTTGVALRLGSEGLRPMLQEIKKNLRASRYAETARSEPASAKTRLKTSSSIP
jgi:RpiR family transcriptional regulator, carbohydrate utilization regulator